MTVFSPAPYTTKQSHRALHPWGVDFTLAGKGRPQGLWGGQTGEQAALEKWSTCLWQTTHLVCLCPLRNPDIQTHTRASLQRLLRYLTYMEGHCFKTSQRILYVAAN